MTSTWVLHLSDPHLGDVSPGQTLDDEKSVFSQPDLETTQRVFDRTLSHLGSFVDEHGPPTVAVVSGDIAFRAHPSGFAAFAELLEARAGVLPEARERIVVVPGNHDVDWTAEPGTPERYEAFLGATRALGCSTPLLDGIDFDATSGELRPEHPNHPHLVQTDELLVIPINSSNWCGAIADRDRAMTEGEWREALEPTGADRDRLVGELMRMRRHDIARVSRSQIEALGRTFDAAGLPRRREDDHRTRIAVLHHQLLPVSTREERKPFEALVNLGLVRQTLAEYGVEVVLHGHKHESGLYWDLADSPGVDLNAPRRRILVLSSPGHFGVGTPVMRAVVLEEAPSARNARIVTFLGSGPQRRNAQRDADQVVALWSDDEDRREQATITGRTTHDAYSRLRSLYALRGGEELRNVVVRVSDPSDAAELPPDYPDLAVDDPGAWFSGLVEWWQRDRSELVARDLMSFNHGERIRRRWGDQIERAITILNLRADSSRALVQLVAPRETGRYREDSRDLVRGSFPAFVLAEFSIGKRDGDRYLDCFGYFRKQEMQFWWPVNLAELARLQAAVREGLKPGAKTGRIVTFSASALWKQALPRVAVPVIDLLVEEPGRLLAMAVALAFPAKASEAAVGDWRNVLRDLAGEDRGTPPKVSAGVDMLLDDLRRLGDAAEGVGMDEAVATLEDLAEQYASHADRDELPGAAGKNVAKRVARLTDAVVAVLPGAKP